MCTCVRNLVCFFSLPFDYPIAAFVLNSTDKESSLEGAESNVLIMGSKDAVSSHVDQISKLF